MGPEHVPIQYGGLSVDYCDCNPEFTIDDPAAVVTVKPTTKQTVEIIVNEVNLLINKYCEIAYKMNSKFILR